MSYFRARAKLTLEELSKIIYDFDVRQFKEQTPKISGKIIDYLKHYEAELSEGKPRSPEDKIIADALNNYYANSNS